MNSSDTISVLECTRVVLTGILSTVMYGGSYVESYVIWVLGIKEFRRNDMTVWMNGMIWSDECTIIWMNVNESSDVMNESKMRGWICASTIKQSEALNKEQENQWSNERQWLSVNVRVSSIVSVYMKCNVNEIEWTRWISIRELIQE